MMRFPDPESSTLELKREFPRNDQIIKTLIGFCNQNGGKIVVGVDNDGTIVGIDPTTIEDALEWVERSVFQASSPPIIPRVYAQQMGEKSILCIEVSEGMNKPYYRASEGLAQGCYIRLGRSTMRATPDILEELRWQSQGIDFERLPVHHATVEALNKDALRRFLEGRPNHGSAEITPDVMKSYGLLVEQHGREYPTVGGILLFGQEPQRHFSEAMIICTEFRGNQGRDVVGTIDCEGSLLDQFRQAYNFVLSRLSRSFKIEGPVREEQYELPTVAVREAILNAVVHRNYHIPGPTKVAIYDDRIEIFSPGTFAGPINVKNLRAGVTYLRNPAICKVFREAGLIEKLGSGLITILDSYAEKGLAPPQLVEGENFVKCILPRYAQRQPSDQLEEVLALFDRQEEVTVGEVSAWLGISRATAQRRLKELVESGEVNRLGQGRSIRYSRVRW